MFWNTLAKRVTNGTLHLHFPDGTVHTLGSGQPEATIEFRRRGTLRRILMWPGLQLGETYMRGEWNVPRNDLLPLFEIVLRNLGTGAYSPLARAVRPVIRTISEFNWPWRARRNISRHYDLDARLFRKFLDRDMQYSCAYFPRPGLSLEDAQTAKREHVARKLLLEPDAKVLDIGCGWGGMALHLAEHYGAKVVGLTLSSEQLEVAQQRARERGLAERVEFRLQDYRRHRGSYDAIVSVGMFEHVGRPQYQRFFDTVHKLLAPGGTTLLHTIGRSGPPAATNPWIRRHIFPGGYIPALSEMARPVEKSGLVMSDLEVLRLHYAETLKHWNQRFQATREEFSKELGEEFCRMWEFYLQISQAAFRWSDLVVLQLQLNRSNDSVPMTRDYLYGESRHIGRSAAISA